MEKIYIHGCSSKEKTRLRDQLNTLVDLLHYETSYPDRRRILELGCGPDDQTLIHARNSPNISFLSIDIFEDSLTEVRVGRVSSSLRNVQFCGLIL